MEKRHNFAQMAKPPKGEVQYEVQLAMVIARLITDMNAKVSATGTVFGQQLILPKGLKKWKQRGRGAAYKEDDQLHNRTCFEPRAVSELTPAEKKKAQEALMFLTEKRDGTIKGRMVYNGNPTLQK